MPHQKKFKSFTFELEQNHSEILKFNEPNPSSTSENVGSAGSQGIDSKLSEIIQQNKVLIEQQNELLTKLSSVNPTNRIKSALIEIFTGVNEIKLLIKNKNSEETQTDDLPFQIVHSKFEFEKFESSLKETKEFHEKVVNNFISICLYDFLFTNVNNYILYIS